MYGARSAGLLVLREAFSPAAGERVMDAIDCRPWRLGWREEEAAEEDCSSAAGERGMDAMGRVLAA
jgi:hypothetical protein